MRQATTEESRGLEAPYKASASSSPSSHCCSDYSPTSPLTRRRDPVVPGSAQQESGESEFQFTVTRGEGGGVNSTHYRGHLPIFLGLSEETAIGIVGSFQNGGAVGGNFSC
ncbi:UNVERIFIED_CONTAM: hypothetical protein K2H54_074450 [Gekko kuhli]